MSISDGESLPSTSAVSRASSTRDVHTTTFLSHETSHRINQYTITQRLPSTRLTRVYVAHDQNTGEDVVIKAVNRKNPSDRYELLKLGSQRRSEGKAPGAKNILSTERSLQREIAIMKACHHPNSVRLIEVIDDPSKPKVYLAMEYLRGGKIKWQDEDSKKPLLTVDETRRIFRDVVLALEYLEYLGIIHRDIKPDNIIWTTENHDSIKLIDFGISHYSPAHSRVPFGRWRKSLKPLRDAVDLFKTDVGKLQGTDYFIAPELVDFRPDATSSATSVNSRPSHDVDHALQSTTTRTSLTKAIDIWSLGVTLYICLFGRFPFTIPVSTDDTPQVHPKIRLYQEICQAEFTIDEFMGADRVPTGGRRPRDSRSVIRLLDRMLQKDPIQRITLYEIKRHPFVLDGITNPDEWLRETSPSTLYVPQCYRQLRYSGRRVMSFLCVRPPAEQAHELT